MTTLEWHEDGEAFTHVCGIKHIEDAFRLAIQVLEASGRVLVMRDKDGSYTVNTGRVRNEAPTKPRAKKVA